MEGRPIKSGTQNVAAATAAGALLAVDINPPNRVADTYFIAVNNPGAVDVDVILFNKETVGNTTFRPEIGRFTVGAGEAGGTLAPGYLLGDGGRITFSPTALVAVAFDLTYVVREAS